MANDARSFVLFVGEHWAAVRARGVFAMVARARDRLLPRLAPSAAEQQPDAAPRLVFIKAVHRMARTHTRFAARAGVKVHGKRILLAGLRFVERDEVAVVLGLRGKLVPLVLLGEALDCGQRALLGEQVVNQRAWRILTHY